MADSDFQVVFRGELTGELTEEEVRQKLASLFRMPEEKVAGLFSGKPVVVKRNLDEGTARKFEAAFQKAGAKCEIRPAGEKPRASGEPAAAKQSQARPAEPAPAAREASGGGREAGRASLAAAGDPNHTLLELDVPEDLSDLDIDTSDAPLAPPADTPEPDIDIDELSVAENDSGNLSEGRPQPPADIDTGDLRLEEPDR